MLETAIRAARQAGRALLEGSRQEIAVDRRERHDVKLAMDRRAEEIILEIMREGFPAHGILSEECGRLPGASDYLWVIDPLDGTYNYARRLPSWCTSIGLRRGEEEILGVIYDAVHDELYCAEEGSGAFLNGQRLHTSDAADVAHATVSVSLTLRPGREEQGLELVRRAALGTGKVRSFGAAALDLAHVACGRTDAFLELGLRSWDTCAGLVLVRQAGGRVTARPAGPEGLDIAVSNGPIHRALLDEIGWETLAAAGG
ncbi:MAG: inositol monophosphatase family protein [Candidatus Latescibacterota bacterium]